MDEEQAARQIDIRAQDTAVMIVVTGKRGGTHDDQQHCR